MIKRTNVVWFILLLSLVSYETGLSQSESRYALIQRPVFTSPEIWQLTKSVAWSEWGTQLFVDQVSEAQGYIASPWYELVTATSFHSDNGWNRMLYEECLDNWIRAYGDRGGGTGQFLWPGRLDAHAPCDDEYYSYYYYVYLADAGNNRIVKLSYDWRFQIMDWLGTITGGGLDWPQDLDINNGGTFLPTSDDYLWVLNGQQIKRFTTDGVLRNTYGVFGCDPEGEGNFCRPAAVVCGRSPWLQEPYDPFANDDWIYVADRGNSRLVTLIKWHGIEDIYWYNTLQSYECQFFSDLEVDNFGQVWAVSKNTERVYKYTYDLYPLCYVDNSWVLPELFFSPRSFSNTGGYLGCGNACVAESWTDNTGGLYFAIGTDILDLAVLPSEDYRLHYITYTLVDPSHVTIRIRNEQDELVKTVFDQAELSGQCVHLWDGTDQSGDTLPTGDYKVVLIDTSGYWNIETNGPVNVVTKTIWVHHENPGLRIPQNLSALQSGPNEVTLEWEYPEELEHWFTLYCDGCLCGAVEPFAPRTHTDTHLIPDQSYVYWASSYSGGGESAPSNADTVFLGSKPLSPSARDAAAVHENFEVPLPASEYADSADIAINYRTVYPGHFTEIEVQLKTPLLICGFNFLISLAYGDLIDFHTDAISTDSVLIDSEWLQHPVRECWIDTAGALTGGFSSLSCYGQVGDTSSAHCKYLWVEGRTPLDECIQPISNYQTLFKFGINAHCISDTSMHRNERFILTFGRLYGRERGEVPLRYHWGEVTLWWSVPGDANNDSLVSVGDVVFLVSHLYGGGPQPCIPESGDPNGDCIINVGDVVYLVTYLYKGGPAPLPGCWHGKRD